MIASDNFIIEDLIYIPLGNHNPMLSRPYVVNPTKQAVDTISERIYDTKIAKITPNILNGVTQDILQCSAIPFQTAINNDWVSTRRFIFMLKVKTFDMVGAEHNSYIQGYTEYDGITPTGNIDGNLVHFINNVIETTAMTVPTPLGVQRVERLFKIYDVIAPRDNTEMFAQRPNDILENINTLNLVNSIGMDNSSTSYNMNNFVSPFTNTIVGSMTDNSIGTEYLSKILTMGLLVNKSREIHVDSYHMGEQNTVDSNVPEPSIRDNRFIKYLSMAAGYRFVRDRFIFNDLMTVDNTIYNRFKVLNITKDIVNPVINGTPEVGDYWHGQDPVTHKAYSLIESSVSLAAKYGFSKIYFTATNMSNPTGVPEFFVTNFNSFINLDEHEFNVILQIFQDKFITEIFMSETQAGVVPMHLEAYIDLMGTSKIYLTYAGMPSNWYTIPTVARSMFSSVITANQNAFNETSFNLGKVIDSISSLGSMNREYY